MITPPELQHPTNTLPKYQLIGSLKNPFKPNKDFVFYKYENLLITFTGGVWTNKITGQEKYLHYQACFPLAVLPWVINMLDYFATPPANGGLPAGKISNKESIDGEELVFTRGVCVGGPDHGGYILENLSRVDYDEEPNSKNYQSFDFPDPFMYEGGLLDFWKDLATKYENGLL